MNVEDFFYYDPLDIAFHSYAFFYACKPLTFDLLADDRVDDLEAEKPRWVAVQDLRASDFQIFGDALLPLIEGLAK